LRLFGAACWHPADGGIICLGQPAGEPSEPAFRLRRPTEREMTDRNHAQGAPAHRIIHVFGRRFHMPRSRALRVLIGVLLVIFGFLGFLPVLGFWMIPLGLLILSYEFHLVRRMRRRTIVWWEKRQRAKQGK
jgi:hypothetical protein